SGVPAVPTTPAEQFNSSPPVVEPSLQQTPAVVQPPEGGTDSDITIKRKTNFLLEDGDSGTHMFWTADPVEWSPIGNENSDSTPSTATDYLHSKPTVSQVLAEELSPPVLSAEAEKKEKKNFDSLLKKLLPVL